MNRFIRYRGLRERRIAWIAVAIVALSAKPALADLIDCTIAPVPSGAPVAQPDPAQAGTAKGTAAPSRGRVEPFTTQGDPDDATTAGSSGISDSAEPALSFISDANITNIDTEKLTLGFGLERVTPLTIARVVTHVNPNGSLETSPGSRDLGAAIASLGTATFSASGRYQRYLAAYVQGCRSTDDRRHIHTKWGYGLYGSIDVARLLVDVARPNTSAVFGTMTPLALAIGYFLRLDGRLPPSLNLGNQLVLAFYLGGAARIIDDDLHERLRTELLGSPQRIFGGLETGATLQFGNFVFEPKATFLTNRVHHLNGLSGSQLQITLSYMLLLGGAPSVTRDP
jgi:hypothetical protein